VVLDRGCHLVHQIRPRNIEHAIERLAGLRCRETLTGTEHLVVYRRDLVPMAVTAGLHISFHYWLIERNLVYNRVSVTTSESGSPQAAILGLPTPQFPDFLQPDPGEAHLLSLVIALSGTPHLLSALLLGSVTVEVSGWSTNHSRRRSSSCGALLNQPDTKGSHRPVLTVVISLYSR